MFISKGKLTLQQIQWAIWLLLFGTNVLTLLYFDNLFQSLGYSFVIITSHMLIIYGNATYLIPRIYKNGNIFLYILASIVLLVLAAWYRTGVTIWMYNQFFATKREVLTTTPVLRSIASSLLIYFSSILFYISIHYFRLREQQEAMQRRQVEAELNLLKAQVQPHFLFNSLNNIYFYAQRESPVTASLLEKLSQIMRYFVDEAPKDLILLQTELSFIRSYIDLEKTRMRFPLYVNIEEEGGLSDLLLPPMLMIPLVENVFKHGIDKRREDNYIFIRIVNNGHQLKLTVQNRLTETVEGVKSGKGLSNLHSRLQLLYNDRFKLMAGADQSSMYLATLEIPL